MEGRFTEGGKRRLNIDPGYIAQAHLILATGKGFSHRPYLRDGIYADLTLIFQDGTFRSLPWTYSRLWLAGNHGDAQQDPEKVYGSAQTFEKGKRVNRNSNAI